MDVYFMKEYAKCYADLDNTQVCEYSFSNNYGKIYYVFIKRKIDSINYKGYYDITTPYGYGGPIIISDDNNSKALVDSFAKDFKKYCEDNKIISEFIRFHPLLSNHKPFEDIYMPDMHSYNIAVDIKSSVDEIWRGYEQKVRKNVNKANSYDLSVYFDTKGSRLDEFLDIYYSTMDRREAGQSYYFPRSFFEQLQTTIPNNLCYVFVEHSGNAISSELLLLGDEYIHSFLGGTKQDYFSMRPNDLLKHKAIEWGHTQGYSAYLLGGGASPQDGIYKYKKAFDPKGIYEFYLGKKIHNKKIYDALCIERNIIEYDSFFPLYRKTGQ